VLAERTCRIVGQRIQRINALAREVRIRDEPCAEEVFQLIDRDESLPGPQAPFLQRGNDEMTQACSLIALLFGREKIEQLSGDQ